jgi:hypothetical protein
MLKTESRGLLTRRPLWLIACYQNNRMRMLTVDPGGDGGFLPVFSFEEEAQTFLALLEDDEQKKMNWSIRQTSPGELISVLLGPCAHARWVALDPLPPLTFVARTMLPLMRVKRELFVRYLMGERKERSGAVVAA